MARKPATARQWREFREKHMMSQKHLSEVLGIALRTVKYVEAGTYRPNSEHQEAFLGLVKKYKEAKKVKNNHEW